jgi:Flavin containing amine oxidoreductase
MSRLIHALQLELCKLAQELSTSAPGDRLRVADENRRDDRESLKKYIEVNRQLKKITLNDQSKMIECIFGEGESEKVLAHEVILALPKRPLERLQLPDRLKALPHDSKAIEGALRSVKCLQLLKCFFILEDPWWEDDRNLNKYAGDVPTREIAYYKSKDKTKGIIMIYTDHPAITFWSDYLREFEKAADDSQAIYKVWWRNEFKEGTNEVVGLRNPGLGERPIWRSGAWLAPR